MPVQDHNWEPIIADLKRAARKTLTGYSGMRPSATSLVHDAWLELARSDKWDVESEYQLVALAARIMRNNMVDAARRISSVKRGSRVVHEQINPALHNGALHPPAESTPEFVVVVDQALDKLAAEDDRAARAFEYSYFGGCTQKEIASLLRVSESTLKGDLRVARAFLKDALGRDFMRGEWLGGPVASAPN